MNKLVVVADLGTFKAFRLEQDRTNSNPRLKVVDTYENAQGDHRISRGLSDQAGQFKTGGQPSTGNTDSGTGERHNICLENDRRSVKRIAEKMSELLADGEFESCYFAASNEINREIVEHLSPEARKKIEKNLTCNLVNTPSEQVLQQFK
jgi:hypothetical protein